MSFFRLVKKDHFDKPEEEVPPEALPKVPCQYCGHLFRPWLLPASGQHAVSCAFCSIIAIHLFNKAPMPQWLLDYHTKHELSEREYSEAVRHLQNLLRESLPNPPRQLPESTDDPYGRTIRDE
jgi:hypothetical protein